MSYKQYNINIPSDFTCDGSENFSHNQYINEHFIQIYKNNLNL